MSDSILLEVLTPERRVFSAQVAQLQFPTAHSGYYGILPGHTPLMTPVGDGLVYYLQGDQKRVLTVFGGFAEVGPDKVTILAREAETVDMIDPDKTRADYQAAEVQLKNAATPEDMETARTRLNACSIRVQALGQV